MNIEQGYDLLRSADAHTPHLPSRCCWAGAFGPAWPVAPDSATIAQKAPHRLGKSDATDNQAFINVL